MLHNTKFYQDAIKTQAAQARAEQQKKDEKLNRDYADTIMALEAVLPDQAAEIIQAAESFDIESQRWLKSHDVLFKGHFGWSNNFHLDVTLLNPDPAAGGVLMGNKTVKNLSDFGQALLELEERREQMIERLKERQARETKINRIPSEWRPGAAKMNHVLRYLTEKSTDEHFYLDISERLLLTVAEFLHLGSDYADQDYYDQEEED